MIGKYRNKATIIILIIIIFSIPLFAFSETESEIYNRAESYFYSKNYELAETYYKRFIKEFPLSDMVSDAYYKRAVSLFYLNRFDEALKIFTLVQKRYRATRYINYIEFWKGIIYYQKGLYRKARDELSDFLKVVGFIPELSLRALFYNALSNISLGDLKGAYESLSVLISKKGYGNLSPYEETVYCYVLWKIERYTELIDFQRNIDITVLPKSYREYMDFYRAESLWNTGEKEDAISIYNKLLDAKGNIATISFTRLFYYYQSIEDKKNINRLLIKTESRFKGDPDELLKIWLRTGIENYRDKNYRFAEYFFLKVVEYGNYDDISGVALLYLSKLYVKLGRIGEALDILKSNLSKYKSTKIRPYILLYLGNLYFEQRNYDEAIKVFEMYKKEFPENELVNNVYVTMAYIEYVTGNYKKAIEYSNYVVEQGIRGLVFDALKIRAFSNKRINRYEQALEDVDKLLVLKPDDENLIMDKIKILFISGEYNKVAKLIELYSKKNKNKIKDPVNYVTLKYLGGLSFVILKDYNKAVGMLSGIDNRLIANSRLEIIYPYVLYYRGWAYYKLGLYKKALSDFNSVSDSAGNLYLSAKFMAAWCMYQAGSYLDAASEFLSLSKLTKGGESIKNLYLAAKSYMNGGDLINSEKIYNRIINDYKNNQFWDDAVFEYAGILERKGVVKKASDYYLMIFKEMPDSPLVDEALYRRAEILLNKKMYKDASKAFYLYINNLKNGSMLDAAYYWYGFCLYKIGDIENSIKVWENFIADFKKSSYIPDAILKLADIYAEKKDYKKAMELYDNLLNKYPVFSTRKDVKLKREKIRYLIFGLSKKEAELTAIISSRGVESKEGRDAMLALADYYISKKKKLDLAYRYLNMVRDKGEYEQKVRALYLLGKYYELEGEYLLAGKSYFKAASESKYNEDHFAFYLYLSAKMMKKAGKIKETEEIVKRLRDDYPESKWTRKAESLLKGK